MLWGAALDGIPRHDMVVAELVGFMRCGDNRTRGFPKGIAWQAGWLAAVIFSEELARVRPYPCHGRRGPIGIPPDRVDPEPGSTNTQVETTRTCVVAEDGTHPAVLPSTKETEEP